MIPSNREGMMIKRLSCWMIGISIVGLLGCATVSIQTDYDPSVDFKRYETYAWDTEQQTPSDALARDPLMRKRIKKAVDQVLQEKGFRLKTAGSVDFTVVVHAGVKERMRVTNWGSRGWYDPWWGPYGGQVDVSYYTEGTLVIDVIDADTRELAWRGINEGIVREYADVEQMEKSIQETVREILKAFPPDVENSNRK
jgi:hypothetical protein